MLRAGMGSELRAKRWEVIGHRSGGDLGE